MKKFLAIVLFGALAFGLGYGAGTGKIQANNQGVSAHL